MIAFLTSKLGLGLIAALALAVVIGGGWLTIQNLTKERDEANRATGRWQESQRHWQNTASAWEASFHRSEALRRSETRDARAAVSDEARACDARVAAARRAAQGIRNLVRPETPNVQNGCERPPVLDPGGLRDALQPAPGSGSR